MTALKVLGVIAQLVLMLLFDIVLYALSPLLFFIWMGLFGVVVLFFVIAFAVRTGIRAAREPS